jgi:aminoglycoside 2'-N-acetyltransferase I
MTARLQTLPVAELDDASRREIVKLCERAFDEDFSRFFELMRETTHVLLRGDDGRLLSHAAWVERALQPVGLPVLGTAYVEAVATDPAHRQQGLATAVLARLTEAVRADERWELAALSPAVPEFYEQRGWERWRGPLALRRGDELEPSPEGELVMIMRLAHTPEGLDLDSLLTAEWRDGEPW